MVDQPDPAYWMGSIADGALLSELSIPGTHDSCAKDYGGPSFVCQSMTLGAQLYAGIRFLDIRCRHYQDSFPIHHAHIYEHLNFGPDVLDVCLRFLADHPRECIVMSIKNEYDEDDNTQTFQQTFEDYIANCRDQWYLEDSIPALHDVRGKIILLRRFSADSTPLGIDGNSSIWKDNATFNIANNASLRVEDNYGVPTIWNIDDKWDYAHALLDEAFSGPPDTWFITFCSGNGGAFPITIAQGSPGITGVNDFLQSYLAARSEGRVGTVGLDFPEYPDNSLIDTIVARNNLLPRLARKITCIRKHEHDDTRHPIRWVAGIDQPSGQPFKITQVDCITAIENGDRFIVTGQDNISTNVRVFSHVTDWNPLGTKFLATEADQSKSNNLLSLPDCPWDSLDREFPYG